MASSKAPATSPHSTGFSASAPLLEAPATVRISSDLVIGCSSIRHSAALRILDHHLHTTGLLPRPSAGDAGVDIYCVGQAVTAFPQNSLLLDELHKSSNNAAAKSHVWVARAGQGSSIIFGGAITLNELVLTTCSRVFVRVDLESGRPMRVTEEERSSIFAVDDDWNGRGRFGHSIPRVDQLNAGDDTLSRSCRSLAGDEVLTVVVGPQHINHGDHVDHAFLAETASHALFLGCPETSNKTYGMDAESSTLLVQYLAPGRLGQELRCHVKDQQLASVWGDDGAGKWQLLV
eukprot:CAMPEP_0181045778 /NCGR_PEP_ID=MMETSP1070-20121207/13994_1 /TAXON_ID=265543 /ORGANISM="Minutocellus polymorphus, Strain NH13" /LENGTH=289 /DNA_ID=CAMNT_0023124339 /DNA_START=143 /DNA_END=1010 /DNA_ORIENTATION=-